MKYVRYANEFRGIEGYPITIVDPDARKQKVALEEARVAGWPLGENKYSKVMINEANFSQTISWLVNDGYGHEIDDKGRSKRIEGATGMVSAAGVIRAFTRSAEQQLEWVILEQAEYDWLVEWNDTQGPHCLRMDMAVIKERLQDCYRTTDGKEGNPYDSPAKKDSNGHQATSQVPPPQEGAAVGAQTPSS